MSQHTTVVVDLTASDFVLDQPVGILDLVGEGMRRVILLDTQLDRSFFDLSSGFASEVVQKAANYHLRVAIVLTLDAQFSTHFQQFADESTGRGQFVFVDSVEQARHTLQ